MDATAWGMLHDLHLTMPFFKVRSNQVNATFPKTNLIAATRGNGFNAAISDDSVYLNFRRSERRVYPSKDTSI
jgi:hypothetical protein